MFKAKLAVLAVIAVFLGMCISGCATSAKKSSESDLKDRLSACEAQLQEKDSELSNLRDALASVIQENENLKMAKAPSAVVAAKPSTKDIQLALKNAGFDPGKIDGKMGRQTIDAIKGFQKANGLTADGKVGGKTWALLSQYLEKKIK
ncbi:MAG: peptidoglycan-binding protein [Candidatus Omnitrophica bacterium]|nr:peptidoglycan-binding protein [Candidatus Omnitrophota bacterium]